ncbi:helix-turn-helix transcriptional regulator [Actinosynnema sp. NPDC050436]|uniref:helix-turn-helix transcriptional regulator n=1 Tax=Actinosynnema sp. NPDC050436 TaxID=3155659 RepID=UPI00340A277E
MREPTSIGDLLRRLRAGAGRSQSEQADVLSERAGRAVTRNEVSRWETEKRMPTPYWQQHCADSFGIPVGIV